MESIKNFFKIVTAPIVFVQNHFKAVFFIVVVVFLLNSDNKEITDKANLYEISLFGPIVSASEFLKNIEKANEPAIKGVLLNVDSPGGSVAPSVEMMMAIEELAKNKPVIAYASGTIASGSYYASIGSNKIFANPGSIVGSIGVIFETPNIEGLMEKIGIKANVVKKGMFKETGTFRRDWQKNEEAELQRLADNIYNMFVKDVKQRRDLKEKDENIFANGRVFTSNEALTLGLIDGVSSYSKVKKMVEKISMVDKPVWFQKSDLDLFMEKFEENTKSYITTLISSKGSLKAY